MADRTVDTRPVIHPVLYPKLWSLYREARESFWVPGEIDLSEDERQWGSELSPAERHTLSFLLAFFATADGIVADNLVERFSRDVSILEAKYFYGFQVAMEDIHAETYSLFVARLIVDRRERSSLLQMAQEVPVIAAKNEWARKWITDETRSFSERLVAFACVEAIFFSSSFAVIFWFKRHGKMPGLCQANDFISRDEGLHTRFACALLEEVGRPDASTVLSIVSEAVVVEQAFAQESLRLHLLGLSVKDMRQYVRYVADALLGSMGYLPVYGAANPFPFMDMISLHSRTNFFERRSTEYRLPVDEGGVREGPLFPPGAFA